MKSAIKLIRFNLVAIIVFSVFASILGEYAGNVVNRTPPPQISNYEQPACPGPGYLWVPGYWAYGSDGYYWVQGIWEVPPAVGLLWTPGYWGWSGREYIWRNGYWGNHVGFYGRVNYGNGYTGSDYVGASWIHGKLHYNTAVNHIDVSIIHNTYHKNIRNAPASHVSYVGGKGGIIAKPTRQELMADHEKHMGMTERQMQNHNAARPQSQNQGGGRGDR